MPYAMIVFLKNALLDLLQGERAQDTFEYVLIIGAVVVAVILAVATPVGTNLTSGVVHGTCLALNTLPHITIVCP